MKPGFKRSFLQIWIQSLHLSVLMLYQLGKAGKALLDNFKRWGGVLVPNKQFWILNLKIK